MGPEIQQLLNFRTDDHLTAQQAVGVIGTETIAKAAVNIAQLV